MKPDHTKILKFGISYGILTGLVGIVFTIILIAANMLYDQSVVKSLAGFVILIIPIIISISNYKKLNQGNISMGQSITVGILTALVAGIITIIFTYLLTNFIITDFWDKSAAFNSINIQKQYPTITPQQLNDKITMQRKLAWITYPFIILFNLAIGFSTALITGLIVKTTERF